MINKTVNDYFKNGGRCVVAFDMADDIEYLNISIEFTHNGNDEAETEFSVSGFNKNELNKLFEDFCQENNFEDVDVKAVYVAKSNEFDNGVYDMMYQLEAENALEQICEQEDIEFSKEDVRKLAKLLYDEDIIDNEKMWDLAYSYVNSMESEDVDFSVEDLETMGDDIVSCVFSVGDETYVADYSTEEDEIVYVGYADEEKAEWEVPGEVNDLIGRLEDHIREELAE